MTWFRAEAGISRHEIIGALAEALNVKVHEAAGLYVFTLAGFADFQVTGDASTITDTTLEQWALWRGKPGRYAAVFRRLCVEDQAGERDPIGSVRGWWRQEALLREQERSRTRPGQGTRNTTENPRKGTGKAPEQSRGETAVPSRGNEDVDVNEQRTTQSVGPREAGTPLETRLLARMACGTDQDALLGFLGRANGERFAWVGRLNGYLDGSDLPPGPSPTPQQLATACRDYPTAKPPNPRHFRAFVLREMQPPKPAGSKSDGKTAATMATAARYLERHGVTHAG